MTERSRRGENRLDDGNEQAARAVRPLGPPGVARSVPGRGIGPARRQLQVGRDATLRGARRVGRHDPRARREVGARSSHLPPRLALGAVAQAVARAARDEPGTVDGAPERRVRHVHGRDPRAGGAGAHDREARRRLPRAHPAVHRRVHVSPQRDEHDHRRPDDPLAQVRPARRIRRLARRRDVAPVAHRHTRES